MMKVLTVSGLASLISLTSLTALAAGLNTSAEAPPCATYQSPTSMNASPVPNALELAPFAKFPVPNFGRSIEGGQTVIHYRLPIELTGQPVDVTFTSPSIDADTIDLSGPNGTMKCVHDVCQVVLQGIAIDADQLDKKLQAISATPAELLLRQQVAKVFSGEAGGVLSYVDCGL